MVMSFSENAVQLSQFHPLRLQCADPPSQRDGYIACWCVCPINLRWSVVNLCARCTGNGCNGVTRPSHNGDNSKNVIIPWRLLISSTTGRLINTRLSLWRAIFFFLHSIVGARRRGSLSCRIGRRRGYCEFVITTAADSMLMHRLLFFFYFVLREWSGTPLSPFCTMLQARSADWHRGLRHRPIIHRPE